MIIELFHSEDDGTVTTTFEQTPVMSSYLLAFVVSELESISNEVGLLEGDTLHRVYVRSDYLHRAPFALENSINALKALEEYVGYDFEMPQINSAGVPNKGGAIENWGMIIYR